MHQPSISSTQILPSSSSSLSSVTIITAPTTYLTQHLQKENASVSTDTNNISPSDHHAPSSSEVTLESNGGSACCGNHEELDSFNGLCLECNHQESSSHNCSNNAMVDSSSTINGQHNDCVHENSSFCDDHHDEKKFCRMHHDDCVHSSQQKSSSQLLRVNTSSLHQRRESNGSSPTTPPAKETDSLNNNNSNNNGGNFELNLPPLNVSTISSSDKSSSTPTTNNEDNDVAMNDDTPSPTTANVRHNVLQKISKWSELDNYGTPLEPTHIIPLKTPIKTKFLESAKKWRPFTSEDFLFGNLKKLVVL